MSLQALRGLGKPNAGHRLCAVVTTYRPDATFVSRFLPLLEVCDHIFVLDNTPGGFRFDFLPQRFRVIQDGVNHGLGSALNRGILCARDTCAEYVVLFDQDSTPSPAAVRQLLSFCRTTQVRFGGRCAVGPTHVDDASLARAESRWRIRPASGPHEVSCLPTSGLLFPLQHMDDRSLFASDLFLDLVDFEWCWRQRREGWRFLRAGDIQLPHRSGLEQRRWAGLRFHVPEPYRHYFQFRDTLRIASRRYVPVYSRVRLTCILPVKLLLYPLILDQGNERLRWMARGIVDALRGVTGIGAASERLAR